MAIHSIVIDPNGDIMLVLTSPVYGFVNYVDPRTAEEPPNKRQRTLESNGKNTKALSKTEDAAGDRLAIQDEDEPEYHYLVSSNQMRLVSSYFAKI
jgi:hypothetical protein